MSILSMEDCLIRQETQVSMIIYRRLWLSIEQNAQLRIRNNLAGQSSQVSVLSPNSHPLLYWCDQLQIEHIDNNLNNNETELSPL